MRLGLHLISAMLSALYIETEGAEVGQEVSSDPTPELPPEERTDEAAETREDMESPEPKRDSSPHGSQQDSSPHGSQRDSSPHGSQRDSSPHGSQRDSSPHGSQQDSSPHGSQRDSSPHGSQRDSSPHGSQRDPSPRRYLERKPRATPTPPLMEGNPITSPIPPLVEGDLRTPPTPPLSDSRGMEDTDEVSNILAGEAQQQKEDQTRESSTAPPWGVHSGFVFAVHRRVVSGSNVPVSPNLLLLNSPCF